MGRRRRGHCRREDGLLTGTNRHVSLQARYLGINIFFIDRTNEKKARQAPSLLSPVGAFDKISLLKMKGRTLIALPFASQNAVIFSGATQMVNTLEEDEKKEKRTFEKS